MTTPDTRAASTAQHDHPLLATLERLSAHGEDFTATLLPAPAEGWFLAHSLTEDAALLEGALTAAGKAHEGIGRQTRASFYFGEYCWYVPQVAVASYLAEARVPDLGQLALRSRTVRWQHGDEEGEGERLDVQHLSPTFYCLPQDPDARHPDARVVEDEAELREVLRVGLEALFRPLVGALYSYSRLGKRALWNLAADSLASMFSQAGDVLGQGEHAREEALALLRADGSAFENSGTGFVTLSACGHSETFVTRGGCCRYYTLPGQDKCSTCVLRTSDERDGLLLAYMTDKHQQGAGKQE